MGEKKKVLLTEDPSKNRVRFLFGGVSMKKKEWTED